MDYEITVPVWDINQCESWLLAYAGRRNKAISLQRKNITNHLRFLKKELREANRAEKIRRETKEKNQKILNRNNRNLEKMRCAHDSINPTHLQLTTEGTVHWHSRQMGNAIYDLPSTYTGHISEQALMVDKSNHTREHFIPRKQAGRMMVLLRQLGYLSTLKDFVDLMFVVTQVHITTKDENNRLSVLAKQSGCFTNWVELYNAAGIKLFHDDTTKNIIQPEDVLTEEQLSVVGFTIPSEQSKKDIIQSRS